MARTPMPKYSVVIPAHNEAGRIGRTLREYAAAFPDGELIVVINACSDATEQIVERFRGGNVRAIRIRNPIGKGGAVRAGFVLASAPFVGFTDADGATPPSEMRRLFVLLEDADAAIGSRWTHGARLDPPQPLSRRLASRAFNLLVRALTGLSFSDTQCGAKVFRASAISDVMPMVETANFAFDVDLLAALRRHGARIVEVPIEWHDQSTSRLQLIPASARMSGALLRLAIKRSALSWAVPLYDRVVPTHPLTINELHAALHDA